MQKMRGLARRLEKVPTSPIRKLVPYANEAKKRGVKVYHLNIGDPDIETPKAMLKVVKNWQTNPIGYAQSQGDLELLAALKSYYHGLGHKFVETPNIQVTSGGSEGLQMVFLATCDVGDEVICFEPFYANYRTYAALAGAKLVPVTTKLSEGFHLSSKKAIEAKISQRTKAVLYCNPNNPTGTAYTKAAVEMLVEIAKKHGLFLWADEVYREFTYGGKQVSILKYMRQMPQQVVLLDSLSKRYSVCGIRVGAIVSLNEELMAGVLRMGQGRLSSGLLDQKVAAALTKVPKSYFDKVQKEYKKRRDTLYEGLNKIAGVKASQPEGAFYMMVKLPVKNAEDFCKWLLTDFPSTGSGLKETVMLAPGEGFYASSGMGKNEVRIAYVLEVKKLKRCVELLRLALEQYPAK